LVFLAKAIIAYAVVELDGSRNKAEIWLRQWLHGKLCGSTRYYLDKGRLRFAILYFVNIVQGLLIIYGGETYA
jgi:hypothetical protein